MRRALFALTANLFMTLLCAAELTSVASVKKLAESSDLIVVGRIDAISQHQDGIVFAIMIDRVIKGSVTHSSVSGILPVQQGGVLLAGQPKANSKCICFFRELEDHTYILMPARTGGGVASEACLHFSDTGNATPIEMERSKSLTPDEVIAEEIASSIYKDIWDTSSNQFRHHAQTMELEEILVQALQEIDTPILIRLMKSLSLSSDSRLRVIGLAGLLQRNYSSAALTLRRELTELLRVSQEAGGLSMLPIASAIELYYRNQDAEGLEAMGVIANNQDAPGYLQRAASFSLRSIHTREALPILVDLLSNANADVRYDAVFGLASYANGFPIATSQNTKPLEYVKSLQDTPDVQLRDYCPTREQFSKNEERYVTFWRNWWQSARLDGNL